MNRLIIIVVVLFFSSLSYSQSRNDSIQGCLKNAPFPLFRILRTDSTTWFSNTDIPVGKSVAVIYFSPKCGHCKGRAKYLGERIDSIRNSFIVWASYLPLKDIKAFSDSFGLAKFSNMVVGRDVKYTLPPYYKMKQIPYIAIYNKQGRFVQDFDKKGASVHDIIMALNEN